jgi:hypothetical protein
MAFRTMLAGVFALAALVTAAPEASAQRARKPDTTRTIREVRISDEGVRVIPSIEIREGEGGDDVVDIDAGTVRVRARGRDGRGGDGSVRIHGPVVVVDDEGALVRIFSDIRVEENEHIDGDVVAVFGSVDIHGSVSGDVVAVFGSVTLHDSTMVEGDAVAIGGQLNQPPTAVIRGESVSVGFLPVAWSFPTVTVLLFTIALGWVMAVFVGWLMALMFSDRMVRVAGIASRRTIGSFLLGILSVPLFVVLLCLLFITVIGIPLAILLPVFYVLLVLAGMVVGTYVLGCKLLRRRLGEGGHMAPIIAGSTLVAAIFAASSLLATPPGVLRSIALFLALVGVLLVTALSTIGTGAFLLARGGREPIDGSPAPAPAPPPGMPSTGPMAPPVAGV